MVISVVGLREIKMLGNSVKRIFRQKKTRKFIRNIIILVILLISFHLLEQRLTGIMEIVVRILSFVAIIMYLYHLYLSNIKMGDQRECMIPTCHNEPHKHSVCRKHYIFYTHRDARAKRLLSFLFRLYNGKLSFREEVIVFVGMVLHVITYLPFKGQEHFPLEMEAISPKR